MKSIFVPFLFALMAAVGNAIFVLGQKKSIAVINPFVFLLCSVALCVLLLLLATWMFPIPSPSSYFAGNWKAILLAATGLFITYLGFYLLYSRFGAGYYTLYAVISIITTSIFVGVFILKETFNIYYMLSIGAAMLTILLFFMGQQHK